MGERNCHDDNDNKFSSKYNNNDDYVYDCDLILHDSFP